MEQSKIIDTTKTYNWFHGIDFSRPPLELAVRGVQRCTPINAQGVSGLLKLLLTGFLFIPAITLIITSFLLLASGAGSTTLTSHAHRLSWQ